MKTIRRIFIYPLAIAAFFIFIAIGCKKSENKPPENNPPASGTVTDIDGNVYKTMTIGKHIWMTENLRTLHYRDGSAIPNVQDNSWLTLITGASCVYPNIENYAANYGLLYNWNAASSGILAPAGWHVPTHDELYDLAADITSGNTSFTATRGGLRESNGSFITIDSYGYWWSTTPYSSTYAWCGYMKNGSTALNVYGSGYKIDGLSVRCVKD
jgi:hypothetical protein